MRVSGQSILAIVAIVAPQNIVNGKDPVVFQGLNTSGPEVSIGYLFPNLLIDHVMRNPPVPAGFWQGVNLNQNAIYLESFIDEIAFVTRQDPLAMRRKLMAQHLKLRAVLKRRPSVLAGASQTPILAAKRFTAVWRRPWALAAMWPPAPRCWSARTAP